MTSEKMNAPRYFCFRTEDEIKKLLKKLQFNIIDFRVDTTPNNQEWIRIQCCNTK